MPADPVTGTHGMLHELSHKLKASHDARMHVTLCETASHTVKAACRRPVHGIHGMPSTPSVQQFGLDTTQQGVRPATQLASDSWHNLAPHHTAATQSLQALQTPCRSLMLCQT